MASKPTPRVRPATASDKEAWVTTVHTGFELDGQYTWRYPYRKEYPEDARRGTGNSLMKILNEGHDVCLLAELPDEDGVWGVVGEAIWAWKSWDEVAREECK
jgi:hypothetical protein